MSKLLAFEEKHRQFTQYQHKGAQTSHTDCQAYQEQYEYKNSGDIGQIIGQILSRELALSVAFHICSR